MPVPWWAWPLLVVIVFLLKILYENRVVPLPRIPDADIDPKSMGIVEEEEEDDSDPELIAKIESVSSEDDLMDIVEEYSFSGKENDVFLRKALAFNLRPSDWAEIYDAAEEGSELARVAKEKAEDRL